MTCKEKLEMLENKFPYLKISGEHNPKTKKILVKCLLCGNSFDFNVENFKNSKEPCPTCRVAKRTRSHEDFIQLVNKLLPHIHINDEYVNANTPVSCTCLIDGHTWYARPQYLLQGIGCPQCRGRFIPSEYISQIQRLGLNVIPIEKPTGTDKPSLHLCTKHDVKWMTKPRYVLQGCGCDRCRYEKIASAERLNPDDYRKRLQAKNPTLIPIEDYVDSSTKIKYRCSICGYVCLKKPSNAINYGCPKCNLSRGEQIIASVLDKYRIEYITQYRIDGCKDKRMLPFDFYISSKNMLIEYQGIQHYEPSSFGCNNQETVMKFFESRKRRDGIKREYCRANNIKLLEIPYWEFNSIENILLNELQIAS